MLEKIKNIAVLSLAGLCIFGFFIWGIIQPDQEMSYTERRPLADFPKLSLNAVLDGKFMTEFEEYTLDQFPLRDSFRTLKAITSFYVLGQKDNNDIYIVGDSIGKLDYPLKEDSIAYAASRFEFIYDKYLKDNNTKVYLSVIPDKNYFLAEQNGYPALDYQEMFNQIQDKMPYADYLDITQFLELGDYYNTDTHWRQENIADIAAFLAEQMGVTIDSEYDVIGTDKPFYGVYYGQAALPLEADEMYYLTNEIIENYHVFDYESMQEVPVYDLTKLQGADHYEMFLSGNKSLISIENANASTDKELIIFRDSFGSSLSPLLAQGYKKVTVIDIRYISPAILANYVEFADKDVLFIYSSSVLNNSVTIK